MIVPKEILKRWLVLKSPGDPEKIAALMPKMDKVSGETIRRAFKEGKCSDSVFKVMAQFYEQKAEMIAQYL